jgi:hypothetical protein
MKLRIYKGAKYEEICNDCYSKFIANPETVGCRFHLYKPQLWTRGMPRTDTGLSRVIKEAAELGKLHEGVSDAALTPAELVVIRTHLLSSNQKEDLMFYTLILVMIKLFLRSDEALNPNWDDRWQKHKGLTDQSFDPDLTFVTPEGIVKQIGITVFGKKNVKPKLLMLYPDRVHISFCPVKHLLAYLYTIG